MRIMQISGALVGAQKTIEEAIHRYALQLGHESRILYACGRAKVEGEICYENKFENILCRVGRKYICKTPRFAALQTIRLIRHIKSFQPDVIHLHVLHHGYTDYVMLLRYLAKANIPVVYTMHDMWAITGGCYYYTTHQCGGSQSGCNECTESKKKLDESRKYAGRALQRKQQLLKQIEKLFVVAVSDWVGEEIEKSFLSDRPIRVIANGVDVPDCPISEKGNKKENNARISLMGVAASWTQRKGIETIFQIAQQLGEDYEIHLVGAVTQEIQSRAPKNVVFEGYCADKKQLLGKYAEADLHMSASLEETFGMTFVEAAFMGTRSVGFASTAITQTLDCVHGVAVKEFTVEAMCRAIRETVEAGKTNLRPDEIKQIRENLSAEKMAERYFDVYQQLL